MIFHTPRILVLAIVHFISVSEITNLAAGKVATGDPPYGGYNLSLHDNAVDPYPAETFMHSARTSQPWVAVDLAGIYTIRGVIIVNRLASGQ